MAYGAIIGQTPTVQASAEMTSYNNDNTSSVITADNVQGAIDQLFTSVSNGKSQIASAITGMGVSTSANDSFAQMATNIGNIKTGPDWSQVQSPAGAAQILAPYQTYDSSNKLIKGTITSKGAQTYTPRTVSQTIAKGQYLSGNQTIQGDGNLKASNIKSGVSIFGVSGTAPIVKIADLSKATITTYSDTGAVKVFIPDFPSDVNKILFCGSKYFNRYYWFKLNSESLSEYNMMADMVFYDYGENQTYPASGDCIIDSGEGFHFGSSSGSEISTSFQCSTGTTLFYL